MNIKLPSRVNIRSTREITEQKRTGKFLFFFETEWWETVSWKTLANDIHVTTDHPIRAVIVNGIEYVRPNYNQHHLLPPKPQLGTPPRLPRA